MEQKINFTISEQAVMSLMLKYNEYKYETIDNTLSNIVLLNEKAKKKIILKPAQDKVLLSFFEKEKKKDDYTLSFSGEYKCFENGYISALNYTCYDNNEKYLNLNYFYPTNKDIPEKIIFNLSDEDESFKGKFENENDFPKVSETLTFSKAQLLKMINEIKDGNNRTEISKKVQTSSLENFVLEIKIYYDAEKFGMICERKILDLDLIMETAFINRNAFIFLTRTGDYNTIVNFYEEDLENFIQFFMPTLFTISNYILETNNTLEQNLIYKKVKPVDTIKKLAFICDFFNFSSTDFQKILIITVNKIGY